MIMKEAMRFAQNGCCDTEFYSAIQDWKWYTFDDYEFDDYEFDEDDEEDEEDEDHPDYEEWFRETYCSQ